jgi:glycosyltransferase involved in cell wall biosynthesis
MPKLSIITINLNNAAGLQKTFDSVFQQSFKDFEYIIMDGSSTDGSKELIEKNADKLSYWVSEKDSGVYHAMNKCIEKAKGDYLLFLNSGDHLINKGILEEVSNELNGTGIIYGNIFLIESATKSWTGIYPDTLNFQHFVDGSLPHPCSFIKRTLFEKVGYYDESLKIVADWKFFMNAICRYNVSYKHIDKTIVVFYLEGLSSLAKNQTTLQEEKRSVFLNEYPLFIENSNELKQLREFKKTKLVAGFVKIAKGFGLLKGV